MLEGFSNASRIPELRRRLVFTALMLAVYRIGVAVPTPGIDGQALASVLRRGERHAVRLGNLFSGGALERFSVLALGIMPYISVAIVLDLLKIASPYLDELYKEGEAGRRKDYAIHALRHRGSRPLPGHDDRVLAGADSGARRRQYRLQSGPRIYRDDGGHRDRGHHVPGVDRRANHRARYRQRNLADHHGGNRGAAAERYQHHGTIRARGRDEHLHADLHSRDRGVSHLSDCLFETAQRRIPIQYARRVVGRRVYGGQSSHLPLRIKPRALSRRFSRRRCWSSPRRSATFVPFLKPYSSYLTPGGFYYDIVYVALIVFFCYFYTSVTFNPVDVADNLRKNGGFHSGYSSGASDCGL